MFSLVVGAAVHAFLAPHALLEPHIAHVALTRCRAAAHMSPACCASVPRVQQLATAREVKTKLEKDDERREAAVVLFGARWCRICRAVHTRVLSHLAKRHPETDFMRVELTPATEVRHSLDFCHESPPFAAARRLPCTARRTRSPSTT